MKAFKALAFSIAAFGLTFQALPAIAAATASAPAVAAVTPAQATAQAQAPHGLHYRIARQVERLIETGKATWYGLAHSHHYTVSGERFDPTQLTAAHRSLPIGSVVRVTDRDTGRSVVVRVNDREPPHGVRCIDLSEGAATALGIRQQGVANVAITAVVPGDAVEVAEAPEDGALADNTSRQATTPATRHARLHRRHTAR